MKVVFLDIDGVLNTPNYAVQAHGMWSKTNGWFKSKDEFGAIFDPISVDCLLYLCETTNAKVVISSTWRRVGLLRMREMFKVRGIPIDIIDVTPILNLKRGEEIEAWLSENDYVTNYVIIDDDTDFTDYQLNNHFVCTRGQYGLNHNAMVLAIKILMERV